MIFLPDLKAHLGSGEVASDPDRDTVLPTLEAAAVAFVERATGRYFGASKVFTEYLDGAGSGVLRLLEDAASLTSVHARSDVGDAWVEVVDTADDGWELQTPKVLRKGGVWERGHLYRVIYPFGYAVEQEPADIRMLVIDLVKFRWRQRGLEGHASGKLGDYGFTLSDIDAVPGALDILDGWRRHRVVAA